MDDLAWGFALSLFMGRNIIQNTYEVKSYGKFTIFYNKNVKTIRQTNCNFSVKEVTYLSFDPFSLSLKILSLCQILWNEICGSVK